MSYSTLKGKAGQRKRLRLVWRDGARCFYCRIPFADPALSGATFDHYVPHCLLPVNEVWNLVLACRPCNLAKADRLPFTVAWLLLARSGQVFTADQDVFRVEFGVFITAARIGAGWARSGSDRIGSGRTLTCCSPVARGPVNTARHGVNTPADRWGEAA